MLVTGREELSGIGRLLAFCQLALAAILKHHAKTRDSQYRPRHRWPPEETNLIRRMPVDLESQGDAALAEQRGLGGSKTD
jgi:hypothetical protein